MWLYLEYMLVYCNIVGGMIYILICRIKSMEIEVPSELLTKDGFGDFLDANTLIVDLFNTIISPALVGCIVMARSNDSGKIGDNLMTGFVSTLLIIQGILLIFGFQVKRVDFDWSSRLNKNMPEFAR